ncbi:MAG TPA: ATP-binding cassette domain-containing protein [Mucilaginibacter sp.]
MVHQISVRVVVHSFSERRILSNITFECNTGEIVGLFGRNGTGKSTLFNILFGTLKPDHAEIYFDGRLVRYGEKLSNFIGYHTQDVMLPKYTKTKDIILMYLPLEKQKKVFYSKGVEEMIQKRVSELSSGQQRYLQLLLLLNLDHAIILLDEPFSMIEPLYKELIKEKLMEYREYKGFILTDHYYRDVLEICDRNYLLKDCRMIPIANNQDLVDLGYLSNQAIL